MLKLIKSLFRKTPKKPEENAKVAARVVPQQEKPEVAPTSRRQPVTKAPAQLNSVSVPIERAPRPYTYGGTQSRESSSDDGVAAFNVLTASLIVENLSRHSSDTSAPSPAPAYDSYSCRPSPSYGDSGGSSSCDSSSYSDSSSSGSSSWD